MTRESSEKLIELERPPITERGILARLVLPGDSDDEVEESLAEMGRLMWTAGADVVCTFVQRRDKPCPATLLGAGKIGQIHAACEETEADLVVFDSDLTPTQGSKLQELLGVKVVDRTQLILDIFAQHAHTSEGRRQVELAQLQYLLPRLAGRGAVMRQQGGIGIRGPGEQKLEVDRRRIRKRIDRLNAGLETIRRRRGIQRKRRSEGAVGRVALVGYTNAGKSSLLNALAAADVFVEDKLFATLDPRSRRCALPSGRVAVMSDTVGFIRKLPHSLVAAFRATLEEINEADVLLLVADAAHPAVEEHIRAVYEVLDEIDVEHKPLIKVFNKTDIADPATVAQLVRGKGAAVAVSARTGDGLDGLRGAVDDELVPKRRRVQLRIPQGQAGVVARVYAGGRVLRQEYDGNAILLDAEIDAETGRIVEAFIVCTP
ncbi:MAG: GTPase HflX [Candidatus Hydrogenedentes bacterium]|nr:GTPase HflX [Candidatus Hydrogenedentota bacterium]